MELLLAILLVSILAYFVFATPQEFETPKEEINSSNLPSYFQNNFYGDGEIVCVDKCKECYYITNTIKKISLPLPLKVINEYILDKNNNPIKIEMGRFKDKRVCLRLRHYKNNSISQVILELEDRYLFIPSYFGEGKEFNSLSEASDWWIRDSDKFDTKSNWY